jgi:hypothetical protein
MDKLARFGIVASVFLVLATGSFWQLNGDETARLARKQGLSRETYLESVALTSKARAGALTPAEFSRLLAMLNSENPFQSKTAKCAMIDVARRGPYRREALHALGDWLDYPRVAYLARAPGWETKIKNLLSSANPEEVKTANWVLAAETKRKAGDLRY